MWDLDGTWQSTCLYVYWITWISTGWPRVVMASECWTPAHSRISMMMSSLGSSYPLEIGWLILPSCIILIPIAVTEEIIYPENHSLAFSFITKLYSKANDYDPSKALPITLPSQSENYQLTYYSFSIQFTPTAHLLFPTNMSLSNRYNWVDGKWLETVQTIQSYIKCSILQCK